MLQNLSAEVLVKCLALWKKCMITSPITVKTDNQHSLGIQPDSMPLSLQMCRGGLLFVFCVIRGYAGFVSCFGTQEEVSIISDIIQQFLINMCVCAHTRTHTHTHTVVLTILNQFPHIWSEKTTQKSAFSPWYCHPKLFYIFHMLLMQFPCLSSKCIVLSSQSLESDRSHITLTTVNTQWEAMQRVMASKLTRLTPETDNMALVAESCTTCCSWPPIDEFRNIRICFRIGQWCYLTTQLYWNRLDFICFRSCCCLCHQGLMLMVLLWHEQEKSLFHVRLVSWLENWNMQPFILQ